MQSVVCVCCFYTQLYIMYCLTNICYVCLKKKNNLISSVNSSVSVNEELRCIIGYHAFNQPWLRTKRIILTCEECYSLLRKTYHFLKMWHKNSALLQGYIDLLNTTTVPNTDNEAELQVHADIKQTDIHDVKREVKLEDEQMYTFQWEHNIEEAEDALITEETKDLFMNLEDSFVKAENAWKREEVDITEECSTDNNSSEIIKEVNDVFVNLEDSSVNEDSQRIREELKDPEDYPMGNESTLETSVNANSHLTNTDSVSSGFAGKEMRATSKDDLNTATKKSYKCSTCSKSFNTKTELNKHKIIHTDKKWCECAICEKRFTSRSYLVIHMRVHTGEKPYECTTCKKCFAKLWQLKVHTRTHTGEKPYECATCKKCFGNSTNLVCHMRTHTGEKPYECATCKKCFRNLSHLIRHMRTHTGEKPYECATCQKCFTRRTHLVSHVLIHTGEKPYKCSKCSQCFRHKSNRKSHMRNKHPDEESQ